MKGKRKEDCSVSGVGRLETLVFGGDSGQSGEQTQRHGGHGDGVDKDPSTQLEETPLFEFCISKTPIDTLDETDSEDSTAPTTVSEDKSAAWCDDDDETSGAVVEATSSKQRNRLKKLRLVNDGDDVLAASLSKRLRNEFDRVIGQPLWASLQKNVDDNEELSAGDVLRDTRTGTVDAVNIQRLKDANISKRQQGSVRCLKFHPSSTILLAAGLDKTLNLFKVEGESSSKLQSVFIEKFPIYSASFSASGAEVFLSSRRNYFHVYDVAGGSIERIRLPGKQEKRFENLVLSPVGDQLAVLGDGGNIHMVSTKSKRSLFSLKMNGQVQCACFSSNGETLYSAGGDGEVYAWSLRTRRCLHKFQDEGCLSATSLAVTGDYIACGSSSGVVNIYNNDHLKSRRPRPMKSIMNLTTAVTGMQFNHSSELLAMSSQCVKDALKLFCTPTMRVCPHWPTAGSPLGHVQSTAFSSGGGYLAVGNDKGKVLLYRLGNYPAA